MLKQLVLAAALSFGGMCATAPALAAPTLEDFTEKPVFRAFDISPDGKSILGVRHEAVGDVLIIIDWETKKVTPIQYAKKEDQLEITSGSFKSNKRVLFTVQQKYRIVAGKAYVNKTGGDIDDAFDWVSRIYASDIDGGNLISLYNPSAGTDLPRNVSASVVNFLPKDPNHVLMAGPSIRGTKLLKVNVVSGKSEEIETGSQYTGNWVFDSEGTPVLRRDGVARGQGQLWRRRAPGAKAWTEIARFMGAQGANSGPTFEGVGPAIKPGQVFVLARPDGQDTSGLYIYDTNTGNYVDTVLSVPGFDVTGAVVHRDFETKTEKMLAACYEEYKFKCVPRDEEFGKHWRALEKAFPDDNISFVGRSSGASRWLIQIDSSKDLGSYFLYDTVSKKVDYVGGHRPNLMPDELPSQEVVHYTASDGKKLWGYLWLPPGATKDTKNLPFIMLPHGGPEGRDSWGSDPFGHWWATKGYAVFQPQFRGGGGQGRAFVIEGHGQWGQRMQEDVSDAARHLIATGRIDPKRMCLAGWSYGGYTTMIGAVINQDLYQCFFAGAGVSDQLDMLVWSREGSDDDVQDGGGGGRKGVSYQYWSAAQGDENRDRDMLIKHSANRRAGEIAKPLLLIHGEEDEIVPVEQSLMLAENMKKAGRNNYELIILVDDQHRWAPMTVENRKIVLGKSLEFFQRHIGPGWTPGAG